MIGIDIRKENLALSLLSAPAIIPALIVAPDREIPGKTASPCAIPMKSATLFDIFSHEKRLFFFMISAKTKIIAEMRKHSGKSMPENDISTSGIIKMTTRHVAIVAIASEIVSFEKGWRTICHKLRLKTQTIESKVATCKIMLNKRLSSTEKIAEKSTKCPDEETGRNSVSPCNNPKKKSAIYEFTLLFYLFCPVFM